MKPSRFEYHAPRSSEEAVGLLADLGEEAKPIAGGQSLVPMLALRLAVFEHLVDLGRVTELRGIEQRDQDLWLGACTTQTEIMRSPDVARAVPLLARATPLIGHFQIRNRGTLGGSIAHADPSAEYPAVVLALDARLEALSPRGRRTIPAAGFFTGMWSTGLADDEILTGVSFSPWGERSGFAVEEFARRGGDFAIAGAVVAVELDADARIRRCGIALFGVGATPLRASAAEATVIGFAAADVDADEVGRTALAGAASIPADIHASSDYRRHVGSIMVARAWRRAVQEVLDA